MLSWSARGLVCYLIVFCPPSTWTGGASPLAKTLWRLVFNGLLPDLKLLLKLSQAGRANIANVRNLMSVGPASAGTLCDQDEGTRRTVSYFLKLQLRGCAMC
jgi:hypothetical protein